MAEFSKKTTIAVIGGVLLLTVAAICLYGFRYRLYQYLPAADGKYFAIRGGLLTDERGAVFSGRVREEGRGFVNVGSYINGLPEGLHILYRAGRVAEVSRWRQGVRDGYSLVYDVNGVLQMEEHYKNGRKNGLSKQYDDRGKIVLTETYADGLRDGPARQYYPNGLVYIYVNYRRGVPDGAYAMYAEDGSPILEAYLQNGRPQKVKEYTSAYRLPVKDEKGEITVRRPQEKISVPAGEERKR